MRKNFPWILGGFLLGVAATVAASISCTTLRITPRLSVTRIVYPHQVDQPRVLQLALVVLTAPDVDEQVSQLQLAALQLAASGAAATLQLAAFHPARP